MRDGRGFIKNLVDMMSAVVDVDDPVDMMDSHGPTIVYKNIFIYWALKMYLKYWTLFIKYHALIDVLMFCKEVFKHATRPHVSNVIWKALTDFLLTELIAFRLYGMM